MTPPEVPGYRGTQLPPLPRSQRKDSSNPPKQDSSDKISRTEFDIAVKVAGLEEKVRDNERRICDAETDLSDACLRLVKVESNQDNVKAKKAASHGLRLGIIGAVATVLAGSGIVSAKACTSFRSELRDKSVSVASGEVQRQQLTAEQIRQNTINDIRPVIVKETLDAVNQRDQDLGIVRVPKSMVVVPKPKK